MLIKLLSLKEAILVLSSSTCEINFFNGLFSLLLNSLSNINIIGFSGDTPNFLNYRKII